MNVFFFNSLSKGEMQKYKFNFRLYFYNKIKATNLSNVFVVAMATH